MMFASVAASTSRNSGSITPTLIRNLTATFYKFQRDSVPFTVTNTTTGTGTFEWKILNLTTPGVVATSSQRNPTFTLSEGHYLLYGEVTGLNPNPVARVFFDKRITVLGTQDDIDFDVDLDDGNNFIDCTGWGSNIKVRANKLDATVGKIRFSNYTGSKVQFIVDEPMEINSFVGGHAIQFINCPGNFIVDAVGNADEYFITCDGMGVSTSHAVCINTTTDIRCEFTELYGINIQIDETGASGIRVLADASATYNRTLPPCDGFKFSHIKGKAGHEFIYFNVSNETAVGGEKPRKFINPWVWDIDVETCKRDAFQWGNCINGIAHDIRIAECATLQEPSHNSYYVCNPGNENCKMFNIIGRGGMHAVSINYDETGANNMLWNYIFEVETLASQSAWQFIQTGAGATSDLGIMNGTILEKSGDEIVTRFDASGGNTRDIDRFTLINILALKGATGSDFTKDGTNAETNWDRTSGNQSFIHADHADAMVDADGFISSIASPLLTSGVSMTSRYDYVDFLGEYDDVTFEADISGYCKTDGDFNTGADAGIPLKLAAL